MYLVGLHIYNLVYNYAVIYKNHRLQNYVMILTNPIIETCIMKKNRIIRNRVNRSPIFFGPEHLELTRFYCTYISDLENSYVFSLCLMEGQTPNSRASVRMQSECFIVFMSKKARYSTACTVVKGAMFRSLVVSQVSILILQRSLSLDIVATVYHLVIHRVFTNKWCSFKS